MSVHAEYVTPPFSWSFLMYPPVVPPESARRMNSPGASTEDHDDTDEVNRFLMDSVPQQCINPQLISQSYSPTRSSTRSRSRSSSLSGAPSPSNSKGKRKATTDDQDDNDDTFEPSRPKRTKPTTLSQSPPHSPVNARSQSQSRSPSPSGSNTHSGKQDLLDAEQPARKRPRRSLPDSAQSPHGDNSSGRPKRTTTKKDGLYVDKNPPRKTKPRRPPLSNANSVDLLEVFIQQKDYIPVTSGQASTILKRLQQASAPEREPASILFGLPSAAAAYQTKVAPLSMVLRCTLTDHRFSARPPTVQSMKTAIPTFMR